MQQEERTAQEPERGYRRGGPRERAAAVGAIGLRRVTFPAIQPLASLFELVREGGPDFIGQPFGNSELGPGPVPQLVLDQADFISWDTRDALQRIDLAYSSGFYARTALETFTSFGGQLIGSEPAAHFVVLRACGLGSAVRFSSRADFDHFARIVPSERFCIGK